MLNIAILISLIVIQIMTEDALNDELNLKQKFKNIH
jgi:hypothetical protein